MDFKPKKKKNHQNERHSEAQTVPGETVCCLAGWSGASHVSAGPRAFLVLLRCQQLATWISALPSPKISPVGLAGEVPRLNSRPGFKLKRGAGLDPSLEGCPGTIRGAGLRSPGYCCTLFQRDKRAFILLAGLGIPTLGLQLDWKLLQVSSADLERRMGEEGSSALLGSNAALIPERDACSLRSPKSSSSLRRLRVISTYIYQGQLFEIQPGRCVETQRSRSPQTAEPCPPPTPCRCQQNPPPAGKAMLAPKTAPGSMKTQPGLPPSGISPLSILAEPVLPTSLAPRRVYSQFLPPILPDVHPQPLYQGLTCTKFASSFHARAQRRTASTAWEHNALEEAIASAKKNLPAGHRSYLLSNHNSRSSPSPPGAAGPPATAAAGPVSGESGFGPAG